MTRFVATYRTPDAAADAAGFEERYRTTHLPLVLRTPGLRSVEVSRVRRMFAGEPALLLMAVMTFHDAEAMKAGMRSQEWADAGANLAEIGGMELVSMFTLEPAETFETDR